MATERYVPPVHVLGGEQPPGFHLAGVCCPRDPADRCEGCADDGNPCIPTECGHGIQVWERRG